MWFEIKNLWVKAAGKQVLQGVDLKLDQGEIHALLGPNGSGKSSLAQTISGNPQYRITQGSIRLAGKLLNHLPPEQRVKLGIALAHQNPPSVKGVTLNSLLTLISKSRKSIKNQILPANLMLRDLNLGFSGGEKKLSELLQIITLKPKLAILDEVDSGLDLKNLENLTRIIRQELVSQGVAVLLITHSGNILETLKPDTTNVLLEGRVICRSRNFKEVITTIKKYGYEKCRKCSLLAS